MASIKYKNNGEYKDIVVKVGDTLPIGAEVDYEGAEVPNGWEQVTDNIFTSKKITNADLNTITSAGTYICVTPTNGPIQQNQSYGNLLVITAEASSQKYIKQVYFNNYAYNEITIAYRHSANGGNTWGEWVKLH